MEMYSILAKGSVIICHYILMGFFIGSGFSVPGYGQNKPIALFLTWNNDPTTTMVIDWHNSPDVKLDSTILYRKQSEYQWQTATGYRVHLPPYDRVIYRVELTRLHPDTRYTFKVGAYEREYSFETMPVQIGQNPIVFAVGGESLDQKYNALKNCMARMNKLVGQYNPKFLLWSGQLPDQEGKSELVWEWKQWFEAVNEGLIDDEGHVIPVVVPSGHHFTNKTTQEINDPVENDSNIEKTPTTQFSRSSAFPGQSGYRTLDFGEYLSIVILDLDHPDSFGKKQSRWIKKSLRERKKRPHVFPVYYGQAYPVTQYYPDEKVDNVRTIWGSMFDRFKTPLVFEFQDQIYKRTIPIRADERNPNGTIYIGHGGWADNRDKKKVLDSLWYLDKVDPGRNLILVSLYGSERFIRTVNEFGQIIDEYPRIFEHPTFSHPITSLLPKGGISLGAELATLYGKIKLESDLLGSSSRGFAQFENVNEAAGLIWNVPAHNTNDFSLRFRYSYPGPDAAHLQILVNGEIIEERFTFTPIEHENRWRRSTLINTVLHKGVNQIELRSLSGQSAPRIDRIEVLPAVF